jgi:hypothetical protein
MASSIAALRVTILFREAASPLRRSWKAWSASSKGEERLALTLPPRSSNKPRSGAVVVGVEHLFWENELILLLLAVAAGFSETGKGRTPRRRTSWRPPCRRRISRTAERANGTTSIAATLSADVIAGYGDASTANGRRAAPLALLAADAIPDHKITQSKTIKNENFPIANDAGRRLTRRFRMRIGVFESVEATGDRAA